MKYKNVQMEMMLEKLKPILSHRNKIGYIAARNTRILNDTLTEYLTFKRELISKYGEPDKDVNGKETGTVSISPTSPKFCEFTKEFGTIKDIEHDIELMTIPYEEVIGVLNGEEILELDWMLTEAKEVR